MAKLKHIYKKARKIKKHGAARSLQSSISIIHDWWFDLKLGVRTEEREYLKNLGIKSDYLEKDKKDRRYQATRVRAFRLLMIKLALPKENVFVDLGSGMGRMLLLAMEYGFTKAVGVEFSGYLCNIARKNIEFYRKNHRTRTEIEIIESDVVDYEIKEDETIYFLFNPFNDEVMGIFFEKLKKSIQNKDREVWIIYNNPVFHGYINSLDFLEKFYTFVYGGSIFHIYTHRLPGKN